MALKTPIDNLVIGDTLEFGSDAVVLRTKTFEFDHSDVSVAGGVPTKVTFGAIKAFSLPVWNSDDEELYCCDCMPYDWDGVTDPIIGVGCGTILANDSKKFQLRLSVATWDIAANEQAPASFADYDTETETGASAPVRRTYLSNHTLDASALGLASGQPVEMRLRRIAATSDEITGELAVLGAFMMYASDKYGIKWPY